MSIDRSRDYFLTVDIQNDFLTGSLANKFAQILEEPIARAMENFLAVGGNVICTRDMHYDNYLDTPEGKFLPVKHCIEGSEGMQLAPLVQDVIFNYADKDWSKITVVDGVTYFKDTRCKVIDKTTFGTLKWDKVIPTDAKRIYLCGTVGTICVISNAIILKAMFPNSEIIIIDDLVAHLSEDRVEAFRMICSDCQISYVEFTKV